MEGLHGSPWGALEVVSEETHIGGSCPSEHREPGKETARTEPPIVTPTPVTPSTPRRPDPLVRKLHEVRKSLVRQSGRPEGAQSSASKTRAKSQEDPMPSRHKAKEMKRRVSQRKATHKDRLLALTLRSETRMAAATTKAEKGKTKVGSKGPLKSIAKASKSTAKASKPKKG
jgi:hypothetical protein